MNDIPKKDPAAGVKKADPAETGINRTIAMPSSGRRSMFHRTAFNRTAFNRTGALHRDGSADRKAKKDVEDIVGGVDINPYISLNLDVSSKLESALDPVDAKYAMLSAFAQGGTATISIARDRNLRRLVAVKSLNMQAENIDELLESFVTEAKVTAQLDHPGIIPIYGLSRDKDNGIHLVMKLVNGKTLREYLDNLTLNYRMRGISAFDETIELRKRLEIFLRVCDTITYAHHRNVIHRDLKPENIMIGEYMEVFVMDWGLAKVVTRDEAAQPPGSRISGTPRYFPPEVLRGEPLDLRSDIFTLGLILQELVTLQYAFTGEDEQTLISHIHKGEINPVVHRFNRKIDRKLQAIIRKATAYELSERYQKTEDLAEDLRRYMGGMPVSVATESILDRILRYVFEHILKF